MHNALQKLRLCAVTAYAKMVLRRLDNRPGKWEPEGYDAVGIRDWRLCTDAFLFSKLQEETNELVDAMQDGESQESVLKESGDVCAVAMMIADKRGCFNVGFHVKSPKVVTLCGSTKYKEEFIRQNFEETRKGNIVLTVGWFSHADKDVYVYREDEKEMVDELHKRKIDLSDEILVINVNGYVGESTQSEIDYALRTGKTVRWLFPDKIPVDPNTIVVTSDTRIVGGDGALIQVGKGQQGME